MKKLLAKYAIVFIVMSGFQCSSSADAPAIFVSMIGAKTWVDESVVAPNNHHFNFFSLSNEDSNYSTFEGNEFAPGISGGQHFTGSYTNHDIQFIYDAGDDVARANKTYKGTVNNASNVITLKGADATNPLPAVILNAQ